MVIVNIIIGLIGLGIVIIVHETGHFLAAKSFGISVEAFSVGWGRKLIGIKRGETEYRLSLIPIGGYCKMKGEEQLTKAYQNNEKTIPKEKGSMFEASPLKRIAVVIAGPAANLLFAALVFSLIWLAGFTVRTFDNRIILVSDYREQQSAETFPADRASLKTGDRIIAIDGKDVEHYQDIQELIGQSPEELLTITIERNNEIVTKQITPMLDKSTGMGKIGVYAWIEPVIGDVQPGSSAAIAGLQSGDRIVSINGEPIEHTIDIMEQLQSQPEELSLTYERNARTHSTTMIIQYNEQGSPNLGISFAAQTFHSPDVGFFGAIGKGFQETGSTITMVFKSIGLLFRGINFREAVSGPIRITYYIGEVASKSFELGIKSGFSNVFRFLSIISVALFVMNLLPIPALDGGQFLLYTFEGLTKRELRPRMVFRYQIIGFSIILGLVFFITFNDIFFLIQQ